MHAIFSNMARGGSRLPRRRGRGTLSHGAVAGCRDVNVVAACHGGMAEKFYLPLERGSSSQRRRGSELPRRRGSCSSCWRSSVAGSDIKCLGVKFPDKICKTIEQPLLDSRIHI